MEINKRKIGKQYEENAKNYLKKKGYHILEENFFSKRGELDLIAKESGYLVFIEVKYRSSLQNGYPEEAITKCKIRSLYETANYYKYINHISEDTPCRFDVVAILGEEIHLIQNAIELSYESFF